MSKILKNCLIFLFIFGLFFSVNFSAEATQSKKEKEKWQPSFATDVVISKKMISSKMSEKAVNPPGLSKKIKPSEDELVSGVLGQPLVETANKYAIVIGISNYPGEDNDIALGYDEDATNMSNALINTYGYSEENVFVFQDMGASADAIVEKINYIKTVAQPGDEVVFFHSGHGATGYANDGDRERIDEAIVWHNGREETEGGNLVLAWDGDLVKLFSGIQTSRIIFIFDSCYSGGMNDVAGMGAMFLSASKEKELAWTYYGSPEGMFSHYLVSEAMLQGLADLYDHDKDNVYQEKEDVTIEEAFKYSQGLISTQSPTIYDNFFNDLLLGR